MVYWWIFYVDVASQTMDSASKLASEKYEEAKVVAGDAAVHARDGAVHLKDVAGEKLAEAATYTKDKVVEKAGDFKDAATQTMGHAGESLEHLKDATVDKLGDVKDKVVEAAKKAVGSV